MGKFADNQWFEIEHCCNCGMAFGIPVDYQRRRRDDHKLFYCPAGHGQHYTGKSEAQKLQDQLAQRDRELERAREQSAVLERERDQVAKAHQRMRVRVMNGVCPCCNRSFDNLRAHMQTQHADYGTEKTLKALREAFGMTQADVASEAYVSQAHVSMYERGKPVASMPSARLERWIDRQVGT